MSSLFFTMSYAVVTSECRTVYLDLSRIRETVREACSAEIAYVGRHIGVPFGRVKNEICDDLLWGPSFIPKSLYDQSSISFSMFFHLIPSCWG